MIEFKVNDMSCSHCVGAVTRAVQEVAPGARVDVDLDAKRVRVEGAPDAERVAEAIREAGYTPEAMPG